jgi:hypothetical protein
MNGFELFEEIRKMDSKAKAWFLTAYIVAVKPYMQFHYRS